MTQPKVIADRYDVLEPLGEGGFAQVYKATDREMGREVAVKLLKVELLGHADLRETFLERFAHEVSVTASLEHPHLVPVYDTGVAADEDGVERPYLVMKLLKGADLDSYLAEHGALEPAMVHRIGAQVLDALSYVHAQGVVHKDLKPANLFLSTDHRGEPHVYVMDFGIAHDQSRGDRMTQTGAFAGTVQYLAPEYLLDQIAEPGVDVYQMGLILVELLSSRSVVPAEVTMPELIARYIRREPIAFPEVLDETAAGQVLRRATLFDRHRRYQDAGQFLKAWRALDEEDFPHGPIVFSGVFSSNSGPISDEIALADTMKAPAVTPQALADTQADIPSELLTSPSRKRARLWGAAALVFALIGLSGVVIVSLLDRGQSQGVQSPDPALMLVKRDAPDEVTPVAIVSPATEVSKRGRITTSPPNAQVHVDGVARGAAPLEVELSREFELRVEKQGFEVFERTYRADQLPIHVELVALRAEPERDAPRKERVEKIEREEVTKPVLVAPAPATKEEREPEESRPATTLPPEF